MGINVMEDTRRSEKRKRSRSEQQGQGLQQKKSKQESQSTSLEASSKNALLKILDELAWFLERNAKSCAAVGLVNQKLLIADNNVYQGEGDSSEKVKFIKSIMNYFVELVNLKE